MVREDKYVALKYNFSARRTNPHAFNYKRTFEYDSFEKRQTLDFLKSGLLHANCHDLVQKRRKHSRIAREQEKHMANDCCL